MKNIIPLILALICVRISSATDLFQFMKISENDTSYVSHTEIHVYDLQHNLVRSEYTDRLGRVWLEDLPTNTYNILVELGDSPTKQSIEIKNKNTLKVIHLFESQRSYARLINRKNRDPISKKDVFVVALPRYSVLPLRLKRMLQQSNPEGDPNLTGELFYNSLDVRCKANLLNIYQKMKSTLFGNGRDAFSYVKSINSIENVDILAKVEDSLWVEIQDSYYFKPVPDLDYDPPPNYSQVGSFKTRDNHAILHTTFLYNDETSSLIVRIDIDKSSGLSHTFHVIGYALSGDPIRPFEIYYYLLEYLMIDPGYSLYKSKTNKNGIFALSMLKDPKCDWFIWVEGYKNFQIYYLDDSQNKLQREIVIALEVNYE